jgi:hypothetical protein
VLLVHHPISRYNWLGQIHIHRQARRGSNRDLRYQRPQAANLRRKKVPRQSASHNRIVHEHGDLDEPVDLHMLVFVRLLPWNTRQFMRLQSLGKIHPYVKRLLALFQIVGLVKNVRLTKCPGKLPTEICYSPWVIAGRTSSI